MTTEETVTKWKELQAKYDWGKITIEEHIEYNKDVIALDDEWKQSLYEKYGLQEVPEKFRERAYYLAYEYGHSSGYYEIENYFQDLVPLLR